MTSSNAPVYIQTQHTPGPWGRNIKPARKYTVIYAGRNIHVAALATQGLAEEELEANADLIAAAPDLLTAAIAVIERWDTPLSKDAPYTGESINQLRLAVQSATRSSN